MTVQYPIYEEATVSKLSFSVDKVRNKWIAEWQDHPLKYKLHR